MFCCCMFSAYPNAKHVTGPIIKLKWRNQRDHYKKYIKKQRTVSGAPGGRKIPLGGFVKQMGFLKPFVGDRRYSYIYLSN